MAVLRRLLYSEPARPGLPGGDRWHLVFDTETKRFCVMHEWGNPDRRAAPLNDVVPGGGAVELEIASYLMTRAEGPGQRKLKRLIKMMFESHPDPKNKFEL